MNAFKIARNSQRTQISRDTNSRSAAAAAAAAAAEKRQQALQILRPFDAIEFTDSCGSRPPALCNQHYPLCPPLHLFS